MTKRTIAFPRPPPSHHKEVAKFLGYKCGAPRVQAHRDNNGGRPVPIGCFGPGKSLLYSTIGAFDLDLALPQGECEFAACGTQDWLPNALASSLYWLSEREFDAWPVVCEDVVRHNARSPLRHMVYTPSDFSLEVSTGARVRWLLGVPVADADVGISLGEARERSSALFPNWLV